MPIPVFPSIIKPSVGKLTPASFVWSYTAKLVPIAVFPLIDRVACGFKVNIPISASSPSIVNSLKSFGHRKEVLIFDLCQELSLNLAKSD